MKDFSRVIMAYALQNAIEYGETKEDKILTKLFQHGLKKEEISEIMPKIKAGVKKVNSMKNKDRYNEFEKLRGFVKEKIYEERGLEQLPESFTKKMVLRIAPFPSGALHIGNAKTFILNALYAKKYNGRLILVMDDTIGSVKKPLVKEGYKLIEDGLKWLEIEYEKPPIYKSKRLKLYYEYAVKLIRRDKAYVCYCSGEELRENRAEKVECGCRQLPLEVQLARWKEIFNVKEGHATLRIKTNMSHPNPAFRDRVLFKVSDREHPRTGKKYRVWPSLEMSWAIDDHELGITHIIRGNDLAIESEIEKYIWDIFGWKHPVIIHTGKVSIEGATLAKSKAQKEVMSGEFSGWDDPRTWSIQSLVRRGIMPEAIKEFIEEIGLNKQNITVPIESLYAINRKIIDSSSNRYSFVANPKKIIIKNAPLIDNVKVPIHPDKKENKIIKVEDNLFVSGEDFKDYKGKEIRLLHLFNIKLDRKSDFTSAENKDIQKINWTSWKASVKARVLMPDGKWIEGFAEEAVGRLKVGEVVQFERFGFCRYDGKSKDVSEFWFGHR